MHDMSQNLPSWARLLGYSLEGDYGAFGSLYLLDANRKIVRQWTRHDRTPNIIELEEIIHEATGK